MPGDMDCDREVVLADVEPFVQALAAPADYIAGFPACEIANADLNEDALVDGLDAPELVDLLVGL